MGGARCRAGRGVQAPAQRVGETRPPPRRGLHDPGGSPSPAAHLHHHLGVHPGLPGHAASLLRRANQAPGARDRLLQRLRHAGPCRDLCGVVSAVWGAGEGGEPLCSQLHRPLSSAASFAARVPGRELSVVDWCADARVAGCSAHVHWRHGVFNAWLSGPMRGCSAHGCLHLRLHHIQDAFVQPADPHPTRCLGRAPSSLVAACEQLKITTRH